MTEAAISTTATDPSRRWSLIWRVAAAATLLIFLWQWPFFIGTDFGRVGTYLVHHGYILAWLLLVTSFTRTVPLRTLAVFWFVGVFPVMAIVLLITRPLDDLLGGGELAYAYFGPLFEELIKPLPILALFAYRAWRGGWQLSATDGLLLGFVVGAGFAFHEDAGYNRVWGDGFTATPWSALFPTLGYFRGNLTPYHDTLAAVVGLSIGFAFLFRRYRLSWVVPVAVWLIVLAEHVTGNLIGLSGRAPLPAEMVRTGILGGQGVLAFLAIGILITVLLESRIQRAVGERERLFPAIPLRNLVAVVVQRPTGWLQRLQAMRVYARQRRSLYYSLWATSAPSMDVGPHKPAVLYALGVAAGVLPAKRFVYVRADAPSATEAGSTEAADGTGSQS